MKKRNILLAVALMGCMAAATAQDVTILHMKDGTIRRYTNGVKESTSINFYEYTPVDTYLSDYTSTHDNGYTATWNVNQVWKDSIGQYIVGLFWEDGVPTNFGARHGVCFGKKSGLNVDNCEQKVYAEDVQVYDGLYGHSLYYLSGENSSCHYMVIGPRIDRRLPMTATSSNGYSRIQFAIADSLKNLITTTLEPGETYYYRIFAEGQVEEQGKTKTVVFYSPEQSFRVPRVMADFNYYSYARGTEEAVAAFGTHFPDTIISDKDTLTVQKPTWGQMETLWNMWRASDEGKQIDISADITNAKFDDGTGYRLNRIPDEFYTWIAQREIVIDAFDGLVEVSKTRDSSGDSVVVASVDRIDNVDAKWDVPGGKYIRFKPEFTTLNHSATYGSDEVVPGVRYKLQVSFAPETEIANTDSTAAYFLPTLINVNIGGIKTAVIQKTEIPATEAMTIEVDNCRTIAMPLRLQYETRVTTSQLRNRKYNRILRIAEARLIPIRD